MGLLSQLVKASDLARLDEHQLDVLVAALDAEILTNTAVRRAVSEKVQGITKELVASKKSAK
jgi:hypothetical protein